jgi:hypothetical protein
MNTITTTTKPNTTAQIEHAIHELSTSINPIKFARLLGIEPDDWQRELLLSQDSRILCNCSRQAGKDEVASILALHHALTNPGAMVVCVAPSLRQSGLLYKRIYNHWRDLGKPIAAEIETALTLQLANRSRIYAVPSGKNGSNIRGFAAVSLLIINEMSRCSDALITSVRPYLAVSGGRLIGLSTPAGKRGAFYDLWVNGGDAYRRFKITAYDVPRIPHEFLIEERKALGEYHFASEYLCEFNSLESSVFDYDDIQASVSNEVQALDFRLDLTLD